MPEGDTIHYAANRIRPLLVGGVPQEIVMPQARHLQDRWAQRLAGRAVRAVEAHGKHLLIRFEGELVVHSHLRMSGAWGVYRPGERWKRGAHRAWLVMRAGGAEIVQFDGPVLELMTEGRARFDQRLAGLGEDLLGEQFDAGRVLRRLREDDPTRAFGDALLDQRTVAGIGNVWKAELCFAAGVDPWRATGTVSDEQVLGILELGREQMGRCAREGFRVRPRAVYKRAGMPCVRCAGRVQVRGQGEDNRLTFWCAGCQT
ncbi:MAG TPA: DNA-formamidopyrimidine glycosylase family protein [Solirubrobacteraceae bacterium]|nr:DNA-formamidopyrimidine glycosylase family protein [Solirubrobacteraceae bacterium]